MKWTLGWKQHHFATTNSRDICGWEADLLSWTRARYMHEFEIKLNIYDFRNDFKKVRKHADLKNPPNYNNPRWLYRGPNYFWYVTTNFFIRPPKYAGWIYIESDGVEYEMYVKKTAPLLHRGKLPEKMDKKLLSTISWQLKNRFEDIYLKSRSVIIHD